MFRLAVVVFLATCCQSRDTLYTAITTMNVNLSLPVPYHDSVNIFQCGLLCMDDTCCAKFIYNNTSKHCTGLHLMQREDRVYEQVVFYTSGELYKKENCEDNWTLFGGHCYFYGRLKATWSDARKECLRMCSHLVEIDNQEESDWLARTFIHQEDCHSSDGLPYDCSAWTGGNDLNIEGQFIWDHSNTSIDFTNWYPNEPSLTEPIWGIERDCVDLLKNGQWNDRPCTYLMPFLCEKSWQ